MHLNYFFIAFNKYAISFLFYLLVTIISDNHSMY